MKLEEALFASRRMETPEQVRAFDEALTRAGEAAVATLDLGRLLEAFDDGTRHTEVMFGLVHLVDRFDEVSFVRALVSAAPSMKTRAPEWLYALTCRSLNARATCAELERTLRRTPEGCAPLRQLIEEISAQPTPLGERARRMLLGD